MDRQHRDQLRGLLETRKRELEEVIADTESVVAEQIAPSISDIIALDFNHPADSMGDAGDPDYEKELRLLQQQRNELHLVKHALLRVDSERFGHCDDCDQEIPIARLLALPFASTCISCSARAEAGHRARHEPFRPQRSVTASLETRMG